jgi:hypothetical protein
MIEKAKEIIYSFLNKGHERSVLTKKNIAASFVIKGVTILVSFLFVPLTIDYLNPTRYGIWITLTSMIAWMALFDIGFGNGMKNKFAEAKAKGELLLAKKYVSSTYAMLCIIVLIISVVFALVNPYIDWISLLSVSPEYADEVSGLVWICFISFVCIFILRLLSSIVAADQRPAIASFIDMLGQVLSFLGILILVKSTPSSLIKMGSVVGFIPVVVYFIGSIVLFNGRYKAFRPSFQYVDFSLAKQMMNLGLKFFVTCCAAFAINQTINFLISHITANPVEVSNYSTAFKIFSVLFNITAIIIVPYWTSFTDAFTLKDYGWMKSSVKKLRQLFIVFFLCEVLILLLSDWIYSVWIGDKLDISFAMSLSVCLYCITMCWQNIHIYPLNGIGKIQLQLYSSIIEVVLLFPLAFWMGNRFGAVGIVLSPVIVYIPRMIWAPIQLNKLITHKATGIWNK